MDRSQHQMHPIGIAEGVWKEGTILNISLPQGGSCVIRLLCHPIHIS